MKIKHPGIARDWLISENFVLRGWWWWWKCHSCLSSKLESPVTASSLHEGSLLGSCLPASSAIPSLHGVSWLTRLHSWASSAKYYHQNKSISIAADEEKTVPLATNIPNIYVAMKEPRLKCIVLRWENHRGGRNVRLSYSFEKKR